MFSVAGYDHQSGGGQVWTVPVGGMCVRQPVSIGGSGSTFLYGMMDYMYKEKMAQADCEKLVTQMVTQAKWDVTSPENLALFKSREEEKAEKEA